MTSYILSTKCGRGISQSAKETNAFQKAKSPSRDSNNSPRDSHPTAMMATPPTNRPPRQLSRLDQGAPQPQGKNLTSRTGHQPTKEQHPDLRVPPPLISGVAAT